jgi:hypothetical protein
MTQQFTPGAHTVAGKRPRRWPWLVGIGAALLVGVGLGSAGGGSSSDPSAAGVVTRTVAAPASTVTVTTDAPAPAAASAAGGALTSFSDGTYEVGTAAGQIPAGKYKTPGGGGTCYWSRLKHNDGALGDIIANNIGEGQMILNVAKSDGYVEIRGCTFTKA